MPGRLKAYLQVALSLMGSAILLFSCENDSQADPASEEGRMTEYSEDLSVVESKNGRRAYHFVTPLVEGYMQAREPYREFRKGVKITTYKDDSLTTVDAVLTANYAIYYEKRQLWEAKGNVVVEKSDGKTLYTQQLFWNLLTKKIYSNVDSKIVQSEGRDVFIGEGFESDEEFKDWRFRRMKGRMEVDVAPAGPDSAASARPAPRVQNALPQNPGRPVERADQRPARGTTRPGQSAPAIGTQPKAEIPAGNVSGAATPAGVKAAASGASGGVGKATLPLQALSRSDGLLPLRDGAASDALKAAPRTDANASTTLAPATVAPAANISASEASQANASASAARNSVSPAATHEPSVPPQMSASASVPSETRP